jgi:hypothetical protein
MLGGSEINLDTSRNDFERGAVNTFVLEFPPEKDCGAPLHKVCVTRCGQYKLCYLTTM